LKTTGVRLGFFMMNFANLGIGLIISLIFGWAIALVILAFVPFMVLSGIVQTKMLSGFSSKDKEILEEAGKVLFFKFLLV
jgi:ATP-binding cassette subfamily B (MDR/TAP) protein 11